MAGFSDVRVRACGTLPDDLLKKMGLPTEEAIPFASVYVAGHRCQSYQVGLKEAFELADYSMRRQAGEVVAAEIGGDEQMSSGFSA